jgi:ABC-type Fe3+-hydroxamate transport system substrate-binding protein
MQKRKFYDNLGQSIEIQYPPQKIISLVPSITELLFHLKLDNQIVGITKFCIHPENKIQEKTIVGGTKNLKIEKIKTLQPDIIFANKEENNKEDIEILRKEFPVFVSDINKLQDAIYFISEVGDLCNRMDACSELKLQLIHQSEKFKQIKKGKKPPKVIYFIWQNPIMIAGANTFIDAMLKEAGFENVGAYLGERYPKVDENNLKQLDFDYIFLSSEPFPFSEKHITQYASHFPTKKIQIVDGEMFSWYGSRLLLSYDYFIKLHETLTKIKI